MDLAAGLVLLGCIVGFSLLVSSGFVGMMEEYLEARSEALISRVAGPCSALISPRSFDELAPKRLFRYW
jgi:hypothetical protein